MVVVSGDTNVAKPAMLASSWFHEVTCPAHVIGMEKNAIQFATVPAPVFFSQLLANTKEGYIADPLYGGNRGMAAWKWIGFPGARADFTDWIDQAGRAFARVKVEKALAVSCLEIAAAGLDEDFVEPHEAQDPHDLRVHVHLVDPEAVSLDLYVPLFDLLFGELIEVDGD